MQIEIQEVVSKKLKKEFIELPWSLYKNDPYWVPQLKLSLQEMWKASHPFFQTADAKRWLAVSEGKIVGRIAGIINHKHNQFHEQKIGHFGFFECIDNQEVANRLLDVASCYMKENACHEVHGPMNPSTNYECGLLIKGFDSCPQIMMTYNPPYYASLIETYGFGKKMDLLAYHAHVDTKLPERIVKIAERSRERESVSWRYIDKSKWEEEVKLLRDVYNDAWEENWGFVPMTEQEFDHMGQDLKMICNEKLVLIVEVNGQPAGFMLALPDYNQVFKKIPNGKLFPFGILKLLFGKKSITQARIITLGIRKKYANIGGLAPILYVQIQKELSKLGYVGIEQSWILEDNKNMNTPLKLIGAVPYKTYRIYSKTL